jgi:hypothetical protein
MKRKREQKKKKKNKKPPSPLPPPFSLYLFRMKRKREGGGEGGGEVRSCCPAKQLFLYKSPQRSSPFYIYIRHIYAGLLRWGTRSEKIDGGLVRTFLLFTCIYM